MENEKKENQAEVVKQEQPAETQENANSGEVANNVEQDNKQNEIMQENAKLKAFRNNAILKQNGFKEEYNSWIQMIAENDGKSFDNEQDIAAYLKDAKFNVFKPHSFNETANVQPKDEQSKNAQGKKSETPKDVNETFIFVPGLDKK